jgi:glutamate--cysteine ligase
MSIPAQVSAETITAKSQLIEHLAAGCKPRACWRIGTEHEKFAFRKSDLRPLPYDGPDGIRALLQGLQRFGWEPVQEGDTLIGLRDSTGANVSLEPGGQVELSGAPLRTIHETCAEVNRHLDQVLEVAHGLDVGLIGLGFNPKWRRADMPWMPKGRYKIMREYMPTRGQLGLDMMLRTCTVQVNLDFESEADMTRKMRVGLALQPLATALFANSPFVEGKPVDYVSYRSHIWTDTDPDRTGMLPWVFDETMDFERWVDYALDAPMYFVYRDGRYIDASGQSFRAFMDGELPALPGEWPTMSDWADHLTTLFPEVRLKRYIEMRGADGGPWRRLCALPALWVGLLYDQSSLDACWDLVRDWTVEEQAALRERVPHDGLRVRFRNTTVNDLAREVLAVARAGLEARAEADWIGASEATFLAPLDETVASGRSPADLHLEAFERRWGGSVDPLFSEEAY